MSNNKLASAMRMIVNRIQERDTYRTVSEFFQSTDTKHDFAWDSYGYKNQLDFNDFYTMFSRFGIANSCINLTVDKCWQKHPEIKESEEEHEKTAFEKEAEVFIKRFDLWRRLKGLDWRQRISRYAGMIMFVADDKPLNEPLEGKFRPQDLVDLKPVVEHQLYPAEWEENTKSVRYGQPVLYQFNEQERGDKNSHSGRSVTIHYTRVVIWAEGSDDGTNYGIPALEPIFNSLVTLERLIGAGGVGYWKAARQSMQIVYDKDADLNKLAQSLGTDMAGLGDALDDQIDDFNRGFDKVFTMQGGEAKTFDFKVPDPDKHFQSALSDVAAGATPPVPATILIGQQTGRLASDEDQSEWAQTNESRRENFLSPSIIFAFERFLELGFITNRPAELFVKWEPLQDPSPKEKLERSKLMASANKELMGVGQGIAFTVDEIRKEYGLEPLEGDEYIEIELEEDKV